MWSLWYYFIAMRTCFFIFLLPFFSYCGLAAGQEVFAPRSAWKVAERTTGVAAEKIYAIALQESGMKWTDGRLRPWPWTINSPKTGAMRFPNKQAAYAKIRELVKEGVYNIDLGMMQINLFYHWDKINGRDILEPTTNVAVASVILRDAMSDANNDVDKAVAFYHTGAKGPRDRGSKYRKNVDRFEVAVLEQFGGVR